MSVFFKRVFAQSIIVAVACILVACGGGSGGSSGGSAGTGGGGSTNPITLSASSVSMEAQQFATPDASSITVRWSDSKVAGIAVGYAPGVAPAGWLAVSASGSQSPVTLEFSIVDSSLPVGRHSASLRVVAGDVNANELGYRTVNVNYTVTERPALAIAGNPSLTFYAVSGGELTEAQTIELTGEGVEWYRSNSPNWITTNTERGVAPSNVEIRVNPSAIVGGSYLPAGTSTGTVEFSDGLAPDRKASLDVTVEVHEKLATSTDMLDFQLYEGQTEVAFQTLNLSGPGVEWVASADESWVEFDATTGTADGAIDIGVNAAGLAPGIYTSTATIADRDSRFNQAIELAITTKIEARQITASQTGVALASMPTLSKLSQKIVVRDNAGESLSWSAVSDSAWLNVTPSGQTGDELTLTANAVGLATDMFHSADVVISSSNALISNAETVKVGLWVGSTAPNSTDTLTGVFDEIVTDPVRPYAYVHKGGSQIEVYNLHTAAVIATIASTNIARAGDMTVSPEGNKLFVYDQTNFHVGEIDLETYADVRTWDSGQLDRLTFGRIDNQPILFTSHGSMIDLVSGVDYGIALSTYDRFNGNLDVSRNGKKMCGINSGLSPYSLDCYALKYSHLEGKLEVEHLGGVAHGSGSNGRDVALTHDGGHVYAASGAPYVFLRFDTETLLQDQELPADAYPNNVEIGSDGLLYGGISGTYGPLDVWIYNANGVEQGSYYLSGYAERILARQLAVSGDTLRMVAITGDPKLEFVTVK